jgi:tetratricopeptide (TPR) repeat protein
MSTTRLPLLGLTLLGLVLSWSHSSAQTYVSTCDNACHQRVDAYVTAAKALEARQEYEAAARQLAAAMAEEPLSLISLDAALRAAKDMVKAGKPADAVPFYDSAIAIANARATEPEGLKRTNIKKLKRHALIMRVMAWQQAGNGEAEVAAHREAMDSIYGELLTETPSATMRQDNAADLQYYALLAARYFQANGDLDRALLAYNHFVAVADILAAAQATTGTPNAQDAATAKFDALIAVADICSRQGCMDEASRAVVQLRSEFLGAGDLAQSGMTGAQPAGWAEQATDFTQTREGQATLLLHQAMQAQEPAARLAGVEQVVLVYPETAIALIAMDRKARLLADQRRIDEADVALTNLVDRLRQTAPGSETFHSARNRLREMLLEAIGRDLKARLPVSDPRWERVRAVCREIMTHDTRPEESALAWLSLAETYAWQGRYPESATVARQFLSEHPAEQNSTHVAQARFYIAIDDKVAGRYDASLEHLWWIRDQAGLDPNASWGGPILSNTHYQIYRVLQLSGAAPEMISQAKQEMMTFTNRRNPK